MSFTTRSCAATGSSAQRLRERDRISGTGSAIVEADADRLAQVASNLLSNARSHGRRTESIDIVMSTKPGYATFSVSNVADALADSAVQALYAPFKAASLHNAHNRGGMGLGLYISERIVTAHNGTIAYAHENGRVVFTVSIPLAIATMPY